ncbi:MAG: hypothetical protein C7B44_06195 [Sulfobacillus thermosulfidooxidans]|nr:MAG: hypothetical protein C7B44_06195 [Sulfobacillus thermosulfidooxidans]
MNEISQGQGTEHVRKDKNYRIIVNAEEKTVESNVLSYYQVVQLAFPTPPGTNVTYTVVYEKAEDPREGTLVAGQTVIIKDGTEFDVTPTIKS